MLRGINRKQLHSSAKLRIGIDTNYTAVPLPSLQIANLPPFFPPPTCFLHRLLRRVQFRTFVPFFPTSLCLPRGKYEWHNASRPRLCHPLSPPSPLGLDSAIELQKRMPAAAAGEQRWVQHARVPRSITIQRVYETPR